MVDGDAFDFGQPDGRFAFCTGLFEGALQHGTGVVAQVAHDDLFGVVGGQRGEGIFVCMLAFSGDLCEDPGSGVGVAKEASGGLSSIMPISKCAFVFGCIDDEQMIEGEGLLVVFVVFVEHRLCEGGGECSRGLFHVCESFGGVDAHGVPGDVPCALVGVVKDRFDAPLFDGATTDLFDQFPVGVCASLVGHLVDIEMGDAHAREFATDFPELFDQLSCDGGCEYGLTG